MAGFLMALVAVAITLFWVSKGLEKRVKEAERKYGKKD